MMDKYGIWAAVLYPNVAGFGAGKMLTMGDSELMLACVQAYNDFLTEYSSIAPERFVPIMALPFWDLDATEKEIARCVGAGHKGVIMTGEPFFWGMPKLADPHWDRLWAMTQEAGLSVNFHIGSGDMSIFERAYEGAGDHANYAGFGVQFGIGNVSVIANLITGGVCHRFPDLKFVSVESGVGWMPFVLDHLDWQWKNCGVPQEHPEYDLLPSEYFKRQMYGCFWFENDTVKAAIEQMGADCSCTRATSRTRRAWRRARRRSPSSPASTSPRSSATCPRTCSRRPPRQRRQALPPRLTRWARIHQIACPLRSLESRRRGPRGWRAEQRSRLHISTTTSAGRWRDRRTGRMAGRCSPPRSTSWLPASAAIAAASTDSMTRGSVSKRAARR